MHVEGNEGGTEEEKDRGMSIRECMALIEVTPSLSVLYSHSLKPEISTL